MSTQSSPSLKKVGDSFGEVDRSQQAVILGAFHRKLGGWLVVDMVRNLGRALNEIALR